MYPCVNGWGSSKLAGFVFYVLSITFALKWAKSTIWRYVGLVSAIFWIAMSARLGFADHIKTKGALEDAQTYIELHNRLSLRCAKRNVRLATLGKSLLKVTDNSG